MWISNEKCENCTCISGIIHCAILHNDACSITNETHSQTCLVVDNEEGKVYQNGDTWMRDSCTKCICDYGLTRCFPHFCEDFPSVTILPVDCPPLINCKKTCSFGYKLNKKECETCKCKMPDAKWISDLMKMYNCTPENCDMKKLMPSSDGQNVSDNIDQQKATGGWFVSVVKLLLNHNLQLRLI